MDRKLPRFVNGIIQDSTVSGDYFSHSLRGNEKRLIFVGVKRNDRLAAVCRVTLCDRPFSFREPDDTFQIDILRRGV